MSMTQWIKPDHRKGAPRRSLLEAMGGSVDPEELWDAIDAGVAGLSPTAIREAAAFFNTLSLDVDLPWRTRDLCYDAIIIASKNPGTHLSKIPAIEEVIEERMKDENFKIDRRAIDVLDGIFERAHAWDDGRSMPGWEESRANKIISTLQQIATDDPDFFDFFPQHPHLYSSALKNIAEEIKNIAEIDPNMSAPDTEKELRSMLTLMVGKQPGARTQLLDLVSMLQKAGEDADIKKDPSWISMVKNLEDTFGRLLKWKEYVKRKTLMWIASYPDDAPSNMLLVLEHFMESGKFSNIGSGTVAMSCLLRMMKTFDEDPETFEHMLSQWADAVDETVTIAKRSADAPPEYSARAVDPPYGKFLFANARLDDVPAEDDTRKESDAYFALIGHIKENEPMPQDVALDLMGQLEDGSYSEVLKEPNVNYVYRGMHLDGESLAKMLKTDVDSLGDSGSVVLDRLMKTRRGGEGSTSWSIDLRSGMNFSSADRNEYSVLLVARVADNPQTFLQGPDGLYKVKGLNDFSEEKEAVALGPVKIHKAYWERATKGEHKIGNIVDVKEKNAMTEGLFLLRSYIKRLLA